MKFQIKSLLDGSILAEPEIPDDTETSFQMRAGLQIAVKADANLAGAYLAGAYLAGAYLADAYLADAKRIIALGQPNGWRAYAWLWKGELQFRVGCQSKSLAEAREYWAGKPDRAEICIQIEAAVKIARLRGWEFEEAEKGEAA